MERRPEMEVVDCLLNEVERFDDITARHLIASRAIVIRFLSALENDPEYSELLGREEDIAIGMEIHDIGKTRVPIQILQKPGRLTEKEYEIVKRHSELGAQMIRGIADGNQSVAFTTAYTMALCHHERWDGGGYPNRLKGLEIPLEARIAAIVDVYEALTGIRSYKAPMSPDKALDVITAGKGTQFDARLADVFVGEMQKAC